MYTISDKTRNILYSGGADLKAYLTINNVSISEDKISKIVISNPLFDITSETFNLGQFVSQQIDIYFNDTDNISTTGEVELSIGVRSDYEDEDYEVIPIGKYIIDTTTEDYLKNKKLTCLDYGVKMKTNVDYSSLIVDEEGTITPITLETLLQWLCNHYEIELGTYPTTNKDYLISTYDSTLSGKYYISQIAELMGGNAIIGRDGKLNIIPIKQNKVITRDATQNETWEYSNKYIVSAVEYNNGSIYSRHGNNDYNTLYVRSNNMFVLDDYDELIENIYNAVNGATICSLKTKQPCDISLDRWDLIEFDLDGVKYITYNNSNITYEMSIISEINTQIPTKTQESTTNQINSSDKDKIRKIQTEVDQQNLKIATTIEEVGELSKNITIVKNETDNPIEVEDAGAYELQSIEIQGLCSQSSTPTPSTPVEIKTIKGISIDGKTYIKQKTTQTIGQSTQVNTALIDLNKPNIFDKTTSVDGNRIDPQGANYVDSLYFVSDYIEIEPSTIYQTSYEVNSAYVRIAYYDEDKTFISANTSHSIFTTPSNAKYLRLTNLITLKDSVALYKGVGSSYELNSVGDTYDTFKDGVLTKRIGKLVIDGSENYTFETNLNFVGNKNRYAIYGIQSTDYGTTIVNPIKGITNYGEVSLDTNYGKYDESVHLRTVGGQYFRIDIMSSSLVLNSVSEFKTYLSNNPLVIYYEFHEDKSYELDYERLALFKGKNTITLEEELLPTLSIQYLVDSIFNEQYINQTQFTIKNEEISSEVSKSVSLSQDAINGLSNKLDTSTYTDFYNKQYTKFVEDSNKFQMEFNNTYKGKINGNETTINEMKNYITFEDGNIVLNGYIYNEETQQQEKAQFELKIEKDRIGIYKDGTLISSWVQNVFEVEQINMGKFAFIPRSNGSLSFRKVK